MDKLVISVYGSHNAAVCMFYDGEYYVVEIERWANRKNSGLCYYNGVPNPQAVFDEITEWLLSKTNGETVDVFLTAYADMIKPKFAYGRKVIYDHHTSHAATALYQSPYDNMLVFTFDGGGDGAFFNVYTANREDGIKLEAAYKYDLGFPYMVLAEILEDIHREDLSIGNLVYAGKLMGLCAYGNVREEWLPFFDEFYDKFYYDGVSYIGGAQVMKEAMRTLAKNIGLADYVYGTTRYSGQVAWDIAATTQEAFERAFFRIAQRHLDKHKGAPVGLAGGCALNVLLNTKLSKILDGKLFVPPNTNDCGIAIGALLWHLQPHSQVDLTYSGIPLLDENMLSTYITEYDLDIATDVSVTDLAQYIADGKIVGVLQGRSEHGSRALGNRSIICSPTGNMKDVINQKVKKREWYRPFAPIVKFDEVSKYFDFDFESRHMTYAAPVREKYRKTIPAVVHEDGTGRLQTVTDSQNPLMFALISEFEKVSGFGVLLNTSFNVNGKPILSTLYDALKLLRSSDLDAVYFKNKLIFKQGQGKYFNNMRKYSMNTAKLDPSENKPMVCLFYKGDSTAKTIKTLKSLSKKYGNCVVIANDESCNNISSGGTGVKTYPILRNKLYHYDRMQAYLSEDDMWDRLKLIWAREICASEFSAFNTFIFAEFTDSDKIGDIKKSIDACEAAIYENARPISHVADTSGRTVGALGGSRDDICALVNVTESILIDSLSSGNEPAADHTILEDAIATYLQKIG